MVMRKIYLTITLVLSLSVLQGCEKVDEVIAVIKDLKDTILHFGEDEDVYKSLRNSPEALEQFPNGPELMTWKTFYAQRHAWHMKTFLKNYEQFGSRSALWDVKVREMLGDYALYRQQGMSKEFKHTLLKKVDRILDLGCNDPRVIYIKGRLLFDLKNGIDAAPYLKKGLALLEKSDYPRIYAYFAANRLCMVYANSQGQDNPWSSYNRSKLKYLGQAASDEDYRSGHQRYYMEEFVGAFVGEDCELPKDAAICMAEISNAEHIDPWIALVTKGIYHIAMGWSYRGDGYAKSVSDEGWKKFKAEIENARQCLVKAYELHPAYPESSANMIRVTMASGGDVSVKEWFNRSSQAHFDYLYAHHSMLWALRPRWGGSHREMLKFGIECLNTGRYDTWVPSKFLGALFQIGGELHDWRAPYRWPGIYDLIQQYFDGLLNEPNMQYRYNTNKSFYALVAWAAGQYGDAHRLMQELGNQFDKQVYSYLNVKEEQVLNDIRSHPF